MTWPSPQDYNEAIQNPAISFLDVELKTAVAECNHLGLPHSVSGAFASVYHLQNKDRDWAVRCFLHPLIDRNSRYVKISNFVTHDDLSYTVAFQFLEQGMRVHGTVYPILKMDWVKGKPFGSYVRDNLSNSATLFELALDFKQMVERVQSAGVAHGDFQHDNIMMCGKELVLVDYDGLFVPALTGMEASELGHRNYQHPDRTSANFGPNLDNFSAWVIYLSLKCLAIDPSLFQKLQGGDDCLLLRQRDYVAPLQSTAFVTLESHESEEIRKASRYLRSLLFCAVNELPPIQEDIPSAFVPELPGLEYGGMWWGEHIGTTSSAPSARIRSEIERVGEKEHGMEKAPQATNALSAVKSTFALSPHIINRTRAEIESEIRSQLPGLEQIVWTGGLKTSLSNRTRVDHLESPLSWSEILLLLVAVFALLGYGTIGVVFSLILCAVFLMREVPCKHVWYGITTSRLVVVYQFEQPSGKQPMRVLSVPLSEVSKIVPIISKNSIVVSTKHAMPMEMDINRKYITLVGLSEKQRASFEAAIAASSYVEPDNNFIG